MIFKKGYWVYDKLYLIKNIAGVYDVQTVS